MQLNFPALRIAGEVAQLLDATLRDEPPAARPWLRPADRSRLRLGGYLLAYGYLSPAQLMRILATQRRRQALLGDLVVSQRYASARVVTTMLVVQLMDQLAAQPSRPDRLGERLVFAGLLRPAQLAAALQLQISLRGSGQTALLGDLLVQHQLVSAQQVQRMLDAAQPEPPLGADDGYPGLEPRLAASLPQLVTVSPGQPGRQA